MPHQKKALDIIESLRFFKDDNTQISICPTEDKNDPWSIGIKHLKDKKYYCGMRKFYINEFEKNIEKYVVLCKKLIDNVKNNNCNCCINYKLYEDIEGDPHIDEWITNI